MAETHNSPFSAISRIIWAGLQMLKGVTNRLRFVLKRRRFLSFLVKNQIRSTYRNSIFGVAWVFLPALAKVGIYAVIFGDLMKGRLPGAHDTHSFIIYLISGIVLWESFTLTITEGVKSFHGSRASILAGMLPKALVPFVIFLSSLVTAGVNLIVLIILLLVLGDFNFGPWVTALPLIVLQQVFAASLGVALGIIRTFFADIEHLVGIGIQVWFWATPIVYPLTVLPLRVKRFIELNPMTYFTHKYHFVFVNNTSLGINDYLPGLVIALSCFGIAWGIYAALKLELESAL